MFIRNRNEKLFRHVIKAATVFLSNRNSPQTLTLHSRYLST